MLIISHPTANQNVRAAVKGLVDAGVEIQFNTSVAAFPGSFIHQLSRLPGFSEIRRRTFDPSFRYSTQTNPFKEVARMVASKAGLRSLTKHETGMFSIDAVYQSLDHKVSKVVRKRKNEIAAVYAYEDGAIQTFLTAKENNIACLYDLPIGYWRVARELLALEMKKYPDWTPTLTGLSDSNRKLHQKDEELRLADHIFVASTFTAKTLASFPGNLPQINIIPYGFPTPGPIKVYDYKGQRPLKVLFVGGLTQRKGLSYLFEAAKYLKPHIELTIVGKKMSGDCAPLNEGLESNTWIPSLPNSEILELMHAHDVLIFPSLFEGFGLVITEAMAQGTPVITTDRTAGPDLITNEENGWLVEAGTTESLIIALQNILSSPSLVMKAGIEAIEAARRRPWEFYGNELAAAVLKICEKKN
ncbi:glycosyltransferase family 4 protein [Mucilaginibacter gotjawali]|uniref:Glycogen synthase n=2 Tax=Mucilaginibacter gotjawali TaxID=1550579 RepID=A0A0X8X8I5_9SPHI|nr:glycosyltransferase family 4 protein [Mucilaginibacter gotjawali]MBB3057505.1 glycosyltransferase involved in cell wall biosynthesis [Mucilaginibacter gotjawali]BAU55374.1 Glycogen synthase [Mucilaginibacter gotjawali]